MPARLRHVDRHGAVREVGGGDDDRVRIALRQKFGVRGEDGEVRGVVGRFRGGLGGLGKPDYLDSRLGAERVSEQAAPQAGSDDPYCQHEQPFTW